MKKIFLLSLILMSYFLTACAEKNYTVDDFRSDEALSNKYRTKCKNSESLNCKNYYQSILQICQY